MRHHIFTENTQYPLAILIKATAFRKSELEEHYVNPLIGMGISSNQVIAMTLEYENGKASVKLIKAYLEKLLKALDQVGVKMLYVADGAYFKVLTKQAKAEPYLGYVLPCKIKDYEHMEVVLGINHQTTIFDPRQSTKIELGLRAIAAKMLGQAPVMGGNIIHSASYPETLADVLAGLRGLMTHPELTCDTETFGLELDAGIGTIAFAWDQHNGIAFPIDSAPVWLPNGSHDPVLKSWAYNKVDIAACYHFEKPNQEVKALLVDFFRSYKGKITYHRGAFDIKHIIYHLFMKHPLDYEGMLDGLEVMTRDMDDTLLIAYLATNSTAGNTLGLKHLAHEFAGNYAVEEINDIRRIKLPDLLQYNLIDCLSTWYVKNKYYPVMVQDQQEELYKNLFLPSLKTIIQMELVGMPMKPQQLLEVKKQLLLEQEAQRALIVTSPIIKMLNLLIQTSEMEKANAKLKVKQHPLSKFADVQFNPNSGPQLQRLLYEQMGLPVIDFTDTKQPATGADTIEKLINHTEVPEYKELLKALINYGKVTKILNTFIPAFEDGIDKADGFKYLHGSFNLGGTVSGRLSSSDPNMQNLPANSKYGKTIKTIFSAPPGWIFAGADFSSLEDRINTLLTKDPNKIKVYTDGYDGHALRAYAYFGDQMPDIVDTVESINSIAEKKSPYAHLRQESKSPTFALTYLGTWMTMVKNLGWPEEKAKKVEANYHKLYAASTAWVKARIDEAAKLGYSLAAFGLRIRTPLLAQTTLGRSTTPKEAEAEARTLGNAISGQSYGLLNSRAMNAFMEQVWNSPYRYDILPVAQIHDAGYYLIRDDAEIVAFANKGITEAMSWQELPEIQHPQVKLGAQLDLFFPNWANPITLPETATAEEIKEICKQALEKK